MIVKFQEAAILRSFFSHVRKHEESINCMSVCASVCLCNCAPLRQCVCVSVPLCVCASWGKCVCASVCMWVLYFLLGLSVWVKPRAIFVGSLQGWQLCLKPEIDNQEALHAVDTTRTVAHRCRIVLKNAQLQLESRSSCLHTWFALVYLICW